MLYVPEFIGSNIAVLVCIPFRLKSVPSVPSVTLTMLFDLAFYALIIAPNSRVSSVVIFISGFGIYNHKSITVNNLLNINSR